ncbi:uncharacterized protein LOC122348525 [Puntigrus tetrazona]|uniref:uncharacterized protein LOC122348525 n=1 Tax=Puntigrus tetrazona TaxID=1606681 RepID=UPI001C8A5E61|nr:uncharacterized protein LOC122348525 [Puntigrus tetrazona]
MSDVLYGTIQSLMMPRFQPLCCHLYKMLKFFIIILNISKCSSEHAGVVAQNHQTIVQPGDSVNFSCIFPNAARASAVWVKQRVGQMPLSVASTYQGLPGKFENDFDQHGRFYILQDGSSFNLSITNTEESDTATYYCVKHFFEFTYGDGTDLIVKDAQLNMSEHERAVTDPDHPEDSVSPDKCFQTHWTTAAFIIGTLSVIVIIIMGVQLYKYQQKDEMHNNQQGQFMAEETDALNYAALSLPQKPSTSRRPRERKLQDNPVYAAVSYQ